MTWIPPPGQSLQALGPATTLRWSNGMTLGSQPSNASSTLARSTRERSAVQVRPVRKDGSSGSGALPLRRWTQLVWRLGCQPSEAGSIPVISAKGTNKLSPDSHYVVPFRAPLAQSGQSTWLTSRVSWVRILRGALGRVERPPPILLLMVEWILHSPAKAETQVQFLVGRPTLSALGVRGVKVPTTRILPRTGLCNRRFERWWSRFDSSVGDAAVV